jgi:hypothetical protein
MVRDYFLYIISFRYLKRVLAENDVREYPNHPEVIRIAAPSQALAEAYLYELHKGANILSVRWMPIDTMIELHT